MARDDNERMERTLLSPVLLTGWRFVAVAALFGSVAAWGLGAWGWQLHRGMGVAGINRPVMWATYIANFVFWVGISHAGTMISAILRLTHADWRRPITRAAEAMTVLALMVTGMFPIIHLGRAWLFYWLIPYPNVRDLWPNFRCPLLWDMTAIFTYFTGSSLFLFLGAVPDFALLRDRTQGWRHRLYTVLALGWRGSRAQWRRLRAAFGVMTVVIIPVFVSVHTIVSWDFGMSQVPRWHTTILAPYFVIGAILSGVAAVITLMLFLRKAFHLEEYLRPEHFDNIGKILLAASLVWSYFFGMDMWAAYASGDHAETTVLAYILTRYGPLFWVVVVCCLVIPAPLLAMRWVRRNLRLLFVVTLLINVGMWLERYLIIIPSLARKHLTWGQYLPSWVEVSITAGGICAFAFLYTILSKFVPVISVWEVAEGREHRATRRMGEVEAETVVKETAIG